MDCIYVRLKYNAGTHQSIVFIQDGSIKLLQDGSIKLLQDGSIKVVPTNTLYLLTEVVSTESSCHKSQEQNGEKHTLHDEAWLLSRESSRWKKGRAVDGIFTTFMMKQICHEGKSSRRALFFMMRQPWSSISVYIILLLWFRQNPFLCIQCPTIFFQRWCRPKDREFFL